MLPNNNNNTIFILALFSYHIRSKVHYILTIWHACTTHVKTNKNAQYSKIIPIYDFVKSVHISKKKIIIYMYIDTTINHIIHRKCIKMQWHGDWAIPTKQHHTTNQQTQGWWRFLLRAPVVSSNRHGRSQSLATEIKPALAAENKPESMPALAVESKPALATESSQHWPLKAT